MNLHGMDLFMRRMEDDSDIRIRNHKMGDFDYVIARHQNLYTKEYNLSPEFCVYVDKSVRYFQHHFDDEWECLLVPGIARTADGQHCHCQSGSKHGPVAIFFTGASSQR